MIRFSALTSRMTSRRPASACWNVVNRHFRNAGRTERGRASPDANGASARVTTFTATE
jgi:hypothetical protein